MFQALKLDIFGSWATAFDQNKIQNPDSTITDGLYNKSKSEVDPDSNSTPKVDFKKKKPGARYSHSSLLSDEGFPLFPRKQTDSEAKHHWGWKIGPEICVQLSFFLRFIVGLFLIFLGRKRHFA